MLGDVRMGPDAVLAQAAVARGGEGALVVGAGSAILEQCVVVGRSGCATRIGRRTVFGHRCVVLGATVGDLCEIGNASVLMPGARLGDRVFLGEGTLVPSGMSLPDDVVAVGRPARVIRTVTDDDLRRLTALRGGDLALPPDTLLPVEPREEPAAIMGQLHAFGSITPTIASTATLFASAEITGDVVVGERTIIGAGVKIIGDSHGPVRIGNDVQILENTVLHLLPDNDLVIADGVVIGPGAMIHGCHIGPGSVVEAGAIVCDWSRIGANVLIGAGAVVKQRSHFDDDAVVDGFPAQVVGRNERPLARPAWAIRR